MQNHKNQLNFTRIKSIILRVIPNLKYNLDKFNYLYKNKTITSYFKNIRQYNVDQEIYDYFKQKGFDMSLTDQIIKQISETKTIFLTNVQNFPKLCNNKTKFKGLCNINSEHLKFLQSKLLPTLFPGYSHISQIPFKMPSLQFVLDNVNKTASVGLPKPFIKKRDFLNEITQFLQLFYEQKLTITQLFSFPAAIFLRLQIRTSGMKTRIVHAVHALQQSLESFYYLYFVSGLPKGSALAIGLTQPEISKLTCEFTDYYTIPLDHKTWDLLKQPILSVISFEVMLQVLPLTDYQQKILIGLRNLFITQPSFHPTIQLGRRYIGTVSGSGFTSLDNSISNWVLINICVYEYCKVKNLDPYTLDFKFNVLGDDIIFGSKIELDHNLFFEIANKMFGNVLVLEGEVFPPGVNQSYFLGSTWKDGKPFRPEKLLVASIILSTPSKLPPMSFDERIQSRFIEIAGNSSDCGELWKRLGLKLRKRLYFYRSLYVPFKMGMLRNERLEEFKRQGIETEKYRSGFWYDVNFTVSALNSLWLSR